MLHLGRARDPGPGPVHTLTNLWIELAASRERITGNPSAKYLSGQSWIDWSGPHRKRSPETGGPPKPELAEAGHLLARREILLREGEELTAAERQRLREIFPTEINRDDEAKWSSWPGVTPRF